MICKIIKPILFVYSVGNHKVQCSEDLMKVDIILPDEKIDPAHVYLEGMKGYPNQRCQPTIKDQVAQFQLPLQDFYECGVTRIVYKLNVRINFTTPLSFHFAIFFQATRNTQLQIKAMF